MIFSKSLFLFIKLIKTLEFQKIHVMKQLNLNMHINSIVMILKKLVGTQPSNNIRFLLKISYLLEKLVHNFIATNENLRKRGNKFPFRCPMFTQNLETPQYIFLSYRHTLQFLTWLESLLCMQLNRTNFVSIYNISNRGVHNSRVLLL